MPTAGEISSSSTSISRGQTRARLSSRWSATVLTVKAERTRARDQEDEVLISERPQGVFTRQLFLGESLDTDAIEANYDKGVLTLTIPVAEQAKPRRVAISGQSNGPTTVEAKSSAA